MNIQYKLKKDLMQRAAAQLSYNLSQLKSGISIIGKTVINGKSFVGILSGNFRKDDVITISFDRADEYEQVQECFNEVGNGL